MRCRLDGFYDDVTWERPSYCRVVADELTPDLFEPLVGTRFHADLGGGQMLELRLDELTRFGAIAGQARPEPFSIVFGAAADRPVGQGVYSLDHAQLARIDIFIVPIGPGADGRRRYEAVFN